MVARRLHKPIRAACSAAEAAAVQILTLTRRLTLIRTSALAHLSWKLRRRQAHLPSISTAGDPKRCPCCNYMANLPGAHLLLSRSGRACAACLAALLLQLQEVAEFFLTPVSSRLQPGRLMYAVLHAEQQHISAGASLVMHAPHPAVAGCQRCGSRGLPSCC